MSTPVRGTTLGTHYAFEGTVQQLEANATGQQRERRAEQLRTGAPKPLSVATSRELADAQAVMERPASEEHVAQIEAQVAADCGRSLPGLVLRHERGQVRIQRPQPRR